jgi:hypothetical protein
MDPTKKPGVKSEGQASPAPLVTPVMLLIKDTNIMPAERLYPEVEKLGLISIPQDSLQEKM